MHHLKQFVATNASGFVLCDRLVTSGWLLAQSPAWNYKQKGSVMPDIQTALKNNGNKGTMNLADFDKLLRSDPRWGQTNNAKEEASKYAYDILKDFGLMA